MFDPQGPDMGRDALAIVSAGEIIKAGFAEVKMVTEEGDVQRFREMVTDVVIDLHQQFLIVQGDQAVHAEVGRDSLENV